MEIKGEVAVVTRASSGIGAEQLLFYLLKRELKLPVQRFF